MKFLRQKIKRTAVVHVLTFCGLQYPQPVDAVDDAAVCEQMLVAKETKDAPVDA